MISTIKLKRLSIICLTFLLGLFWAGKAGATHFAAVDIYVDYIGTGPNDLTYRVTLKIYRACELPNADLSAQESVTISAPSCNLTLPALPMPTVQGPDTLDQLCPNFAPINSCRVQGSPWPAFIRRTYQNVVTLPSPCADWTFRWTSSARNNAIANICNPGGQAIIVLCQLNNVLNYANSSPRLVVDPIPYFCANIPALFYNGPVDPNLDSISVQPAMPLGCGSCGATPCTGTPPNLEIPYVNGYSLASPFNNAPPPGPAYTVNSLTGIASFTPVTTGKFVVAFRVYEYDKATKTMLGFTTRDVQVSVLNCNAGPPEIDKYPHNIVGADLDTTSGNVIRTCPGTEIKFEVQASSQTISNSIFMTAALPAPGMTFNVPNNGQSPVIGYFTWTPTFTDIGDHYIVVEAKDSTCNNNQPIVFRSYMVLAIKVITGVDAGPDRYGYCALNNEPIRLSAGDSMSDRSYHWYNALTGDSANIITPTSVSPWVYTNQTTPYVVYAQGLPPNCKNRDTVVVNIDNSNSFVLSPKSPFVVCRPGYHQLHVDTILGPQPLSNLPCGTSGTVSNTVADSAFINIPYYAPLPNGPTFNSSSSPFYGSFVTSRHQYLFDATDLRRSGMHSGTITDLTLFLNGYGTGTGSFDNFKIYLKCVSKENFGQTPAFETGTTLVYTAPGPVVVSSGQPNTPIVFTLDNPYNWDTSQNLVVEFCYANAAITPSVFTKSFVVGPNPIRSLYAHAASGNVCSAGTPLVSSEIPQIKFNFWDAPPVPYTYTWTPGTFLSDSADRHPTAYIPKSTKYVVYSKGRNGCLFRDSIDIFMPQQNFTIDPIDTAICLNEDLLIRTYPDDAAIDYMWNEISQNGTFMPAVNLDTDRVANVLYTPTQVGNFKHSVIMTGFYYGTGCPDTLFSTVTVKPLPVVDILNQDTVIKYGRSLQLLVTGGYLYAWSPVGTLSDPNIVNPIATPTDPITYYVVGIGNNGCRSTDSVNVKIDYRDNLFVPTAFTPNGDGKNDEFKVVNLTFQKIMEFRVFNRWGQEVYSTTTNKGWDGKWKGVDQEMGTYTYIIRVGYPDSVVETYKGDVTLIR